MKKPDNLCLAPFVHTYLSPLSERRLCCASREPAQNFKQYIDTKKGTGEYNPLTLEEHWNSAYMKNIRHKMMNDEIIDACEVCNNKLLNTDIYRDYFWHLFKHKYDNIWKETDETGYTTMKPVSWDYRFSNLCNFKCRMCGDVLSSSWESEQQHFNTIDWKNSKNNWMRPEIRTKISKFQSDIVEQEFANAVEEHNIEEIYWVGGEPLMFEQHWKYMNRIIELGDGKNIYVRYNTNLSRIQYKGLHLFDDILSNIRDWQICASLDGTGVIGEYIRTGLKYKDFLSHFKTGMAAQVRSNQMRLDFTLTLPGLYEVKNMFNLSKELNSQLLTKVCFAFSPDILMSPMSLPRYLLDPLIDDLLEYCEPTATLNQQSLIDILKNMKHRQTFEEEWPKSYKKEAEKGKQYLIEIERRRKNPTTLDCILTKDILTWWKNI